jgi:hypothetical protein
MSRFVLSILLFAVLLTAQAEVTVTPSEVYSQVLLIEKETELVKRHFSSTKQPAPVTEIVFDAQPRHVWQKGYMLQIKLAAFRRRHQLNGIAPVGIEPSEHVDPRYTWGQTQRILTEIRIIRKVLGIRGEAGNAPHVENKTSQDVFNKLAQIEAEWDVLTGGGLDTSYTFSEALRLNEDANTILRQLTVFDNAVPPIKNPTDTATDALAQAFSVLEQVQRLQKQVGLDIVDLSAFHKTEQAAPADVFNMVCLVLAELQQIKDRIGLKHAITPMASYHENKKPADVRQLLGYITHKLALIEHL